MNKPIPPDMLVLHGPHYAPVPEMNIVSFQNNGLIEIEAVQTFGVSAKDIDNPFGFFGTGMKYAIAILLRENHRITLYRGLEKFEFTAESKEIRGQGFNIVRMNGQNMGFTTLLGQNWHLWQAFRELYCNTMDEQGNVSPTQLAPSPDKTTVIIEGDGFYQQYIERGDIILDEPVEYDLLEMRTINRHGKSLYMKTIKVLNLNDAHSYMTYDFKTNLELTEDRTLASQHQVAQCFRRELVEGDNRQFIEKFIRAPSDSFEGRLDLNWASDCPSETFISVMTKTDFKDIGNKTLVDKFNSFSERAKKPTARELTKIEKKQLQRAEDVLINLNLYQRKYPIYLSDELKNNVLAMVYQQDIWLSAKVFQQGTKQVAATLLEEYLHRDKGYEDLTYDFQTHLFDIILTLGEAVTGEPV